MEDRGSPQPPELETFKTWNSSTPLLHKPPSSSEHYPEHQHNPERFRKSRSTKIPSPDTLKPFQEIKPTLSLEVYPDTPTPAGRNPKYSNPYPYFELHSDPVDLDHHTFVETRVEAVNAETPTSTREYLGSSLLQPTRSPTSSGRNLIRFLSSPLNHSSGSHHSSTTHLDYPSQSSYRQLGGSTSQINLPVSPSSRPGGQINRSISHLPQSTSHNNLTQTDLIKPRSTVHKSVSELFHPARERTQSSSRFIRSSQRDLRSGSREIIPVSTSDLKSLTNKPTARNLGSPEVVSGTAGISRESAKTHQRNFPRSESLLTFSPSVRRSTSFNEPSPRATPRRGSLRQNRLPGRIDKAAEGYGERRKEDDGFVKQVNLEKNPQHFGRTLEKGRSESLLSGKQEWNIFPNFDNLKEVLFGDSRTLLPGSNNRCNTDTSSNKKSAILPQDRRGVRSSRSPVKDEFTEFSQYGSRFTLNQTDEKEKEKKEKLKEKKTGGKGEEKEKKEKKVVGVHKPPIGKRQEDRQGVPGVHDVHAVHGCKGVPGAKCSSDKKDEHERNFIKKQSNPAEIIHTDKHSEISPIPPPVQRRQKDKSAVVEEKPAKFSMAEKLKISEKFSFRPKPKLENLTSGSPSMHPHPTHLRPNIKLKSVGHKSDSDSGYGDINAVAENKIKQIDIESEYDLIQLLSEGWISKLYLAENRLSREEVVLKAINSNMITPEEFHREYQFSSFFSSHSNIVKVFENVFQSDGFYVFSTEYAPLGDLSSNIGEAGLGELYSKRVAAQVAAALGYIHSKNLCHLNVKLENILVFQSDFSLVKLADFGAVKTVGDIILKKNDQLPYCPPEIVGKHAKEYYQVDRVQDVFQFGIVLLYCLLGVLPWQKPDHTDSNFNQFSLWRRKKSSKIPRPFKGLTARCQKLFRKILDPDPERRVPISEIQKYLEDRWIRKGSKPILEVRTGDHHSQLTLGSFQSVHSNAVEKNRVLYTLLQYGVETTVDRRQKTHRIMTWIKQGAERGDNLSPSCQNFPEEYIPEEVYDTQDEKEDDIEELDAVDLAADE